jgi:hypothetical protein
MKLDVFLRKAFDTKCQSIKRSTAAKILRLNRKTVRRVPAGWKFFHWAEPALISHKPIDTDVNL